MNNQRIFNKVARHLLEQKERSILADLAGSTDVHAPIEDHAENFYDSAYYGTGLESGEPARCAIGCLIPAKVYSKHIENMSVTQLLRAPHSDPAISRVRDHLTRLAAEPSGVKLLVELQSVHDTWDDYPDALRDIAVEFHLKTDVLETAK